MKENIHKSCIKGLLMRINEGLQVNNQKKKKTIQFKKNGPSNRHFSKRDIQMANKDIKRCSASLIIK